MSTSVTPVKKAVSQDDIASPLLPLPPRPSTRGYKTALIAGVLLFIMLLVIGILPRLRRHSELSAIAREQENALPVVSVITPQEAGATHELILPATTQAIQETLISARTGGYVRRWYAGMGQHVNEGQLLAEIDTPEVNQELREADQQKAEADQNVMQARSELGQAQAGLEQSEAALKQARTGLELARVNLERSKTLVREGVLSRQDLDDKQAAFDARQADVEAAQANIRARQAAIKAQQSAIDARQSTFNARQANSQRLADMQSFQKVTAPYAGIITGRNVEVGTLINSSGGTASNSGLYSIARTDTIRVFLSVPQTFASEIHAGLPIEVLVKEMQKTFSGSVFGTSNSIDPASRTLKVEVRIPNADGQLLPGMYVQVKLAVGSSNRAVTIPANTLAIGAEGTRVLIVRGDQTVHYQLVEIGRDFGKEVEIISGLSSHEQIVTNPTDALREGTKVQTVKGP